MTVQTGLPLVFGAAFLILFVRIILYRRAHKPQQERAIWIAAVVLLVVSVGVMLFMRHV
jgi:hypothetical protein